MSRYINRINKEIKIISDNNYNIEIFKYNDVKTILKLILYNKTIKIILLNSKEISYPFYKPKVFINNTNYNCYLSNISRYIYFKLTKIKNKHCICCNSLLCNWSPIIKLLDIKKKLNIL